MYVRSTLPRLLFWLPLAPMSAGYATPESYVPAAVRRSKAILLPHSHGTLAGSCGFGWCRGGVRRAVEAHPPALVVRQEFGVAGPVVNAACGNSRRRRRRFLPPQQMHGAGVKSLRDWCRVAACGLPTSSSSRSGCLSAPAGAPR